MAGLNFMKWNDDIMEEIDMLCSKRDRKPRNNTSQNVQ